MSRKVHILTFQKFTTYFQKMLLRKGRNVSIKYYTDHNCFYQNGERPDNNLKQQKS